MEDFFKGNLHFEKIVFQGRSFSPNEIQTEVDALTDYLKENVDKNSPFIYLFASNHIKTVIAYFAIIKSNHISVIIDPFIKNNELEDLFLESDPGATISFDENNFAFDWDSDVKFRKSNVKWSTQLEDVCTMVYTNAEDGWYKGALLTFENILSNTRALVFGDEITNKSNLVAILPFHHLYGFQIGILAPLLAQCSVIILPNRLLLKHKSIEFILERGKLTHLYSIPIVFYLLSKVPNIKNLMTGINTVVSGGYKLDSSVRQSFEKKSGAEIREGYGLTEASPICSSNWSLYKNIKGSIGKPGKGVEIRVQNNKGENLPEGQLGEFYVRGRNVMKGYFNDNAQEIIDPKKWLKTGDMGKISNGYLYFYYTKKFFYINCGQNIYPNELIRQILKNENVKNVQINAEESIATGHILHGKITMQSYEPDKLKALKDWIRENISAFKIPKNIKYQ